MLDTGIRVVRGVGIDGTAKETYESNNSGAEFIQADLQEVPPHTITAGVDMSGGLLLAG